MSHTQIKKLAAPKTWPIARKSKERWIAKPLPGAHKLENSLALSVILRDFLKLAPTRREIKQLLNNKLVLVNNKIIKETNYNVGLFDVLSIPKISKQYRIVFNSKGKLHIQEINKDEANILPMKVRNVRKVKGGKLQASFVNGFNMLKKFPTNSVVLYDLEKNKDIKTIELKSGCLVTATSGKHAGTIATLKEIKEIKVLKTKKLATLTDGKEDWKTDAAYLFAVGETKPEFTAVKQ